MKRRYLLAFALPALLTGCGVVAAFIPPIEVGDMLGIDGQTFTTTFTDSTALSVQAVSTAEESVSRSFEDVNLDLRGFSLKGLDIKIGLDPLVVLTAPDEAAEFPQQFTLIGVLASSTIRDEVHGEIIMSAERPVNLSFARDESSCTGTSCSYYTDGDEIRRVLSINIPASDRSVLQRFITVIRLAGEPTPNSSQFTMGVAVDSEPSLGGFNATFKLHSEGTTIRLGG